MKNLSIIIRNLLRNKLFTGLNIIGLSIGLTCVLSIALWVYNETGYDRFNKNFDRIYQVNFRNQNGEFAMAGTPDPLAPAIKTNVPIVEYAARVRKAPGFAFKYKNNMFFEENGITADPQLFNIFSFQILSGNPLKDLDQLDCIVVTESFAKRYFGTEDPLGKTLQIEGRDFITIRAVIKDIPQQSHIQFDYILPQKLLETFHFCGLEWGDPNFRTYVLLTKGSNPTDAAQEITGVAKDNGMPHVKYGGLVAYLRPLKTIYLDYSVDNRLGETGDYRYIYIFGTVAFLILVLACINFVNLTVSLYARKQKDTSVKKVCGASRTAVFLNSIAESGSLVILAFIAALISFGSLRNSIQTALNKHFDEQIFNAEFAGIVGLIFIAALVLCTVYPAIVFSGTRAISLMNRYNKRKSEILKGMAIFQNVISVFLIIAAIGVNKQMQYVRHKKLGFNTSQISYIYLQGNISQNISVFKQMMAENPNITEISLKDCLPYNQVNGTVGISWKVDGEWKNQDAKQPIGMETTRIDEDYFNMMGVEFAAGRNFLKEMDSDKQNYIVNEEAVRQMGLDNPVGTEFSLYNNKGIIVGVIKDTYFKSLHDKINPQVFHLYNNLAAESYFSSLFFKINGNIPQTLDYVKKIWVQNNPGIPFEYHFLNEDYEKLYKKDNQIACMLNLFTVLGVLIACLGLLGQVVISCENKIKEIGIRKVNGAKIVQVMALLNKDFKMDNSGFHLCQSHWMVRNE